MWYMATMEQFDGSDSDDDDYISENDDLSDQAESRSADSSEDCQILPGPAKKPKVANSVDC